MSDLENRISKLEHTAISQGGNVCKCPHRWGESGLRAVIGAPPSDDSELLPVDQLVSCLRSARNCSESDSRERCAKCGSAGGGEPEVTV